MGNFFSSVFLTVHIYLKRYFQKKLWCLKSATWGKKNLVVFYYMTNLADLADLATLRDLVDLVD